MSSESGPLHRREYGEHALRRKDLLADPIQQFRNWYRAAHEAGHRDPSAMTLATADKAGTPHARMVLLKAADERGFIFCTHQNSPKGLDLQANPRAALVFYWPKLERQVRVEGDVRWLSKLENAEFFAARPRGAQIAASLGGQSEPVQNREDLERLYADAQVRYANTEIPPSETWGGYAITPTMIEFWQGGEHRLHDRFRYTVVDGEWKIQRLMP